MLRDKFNRNKELAKKFKSLKKEFNKIKSTIEEFYID